MSIMRMRLREGGTLVGSWINTASPIVAELMAASGFDFLTVDAEHSAVDLPQVQVLFQAIRSGNPDCAPLVRVPGCDYAQIKRYMDAGAAGIICPLINTPEQATIVVDAVKYPPVGRRGVGFCRDNAYGATLKERIQRANRETVVCVQIEHISGVECIDAILKVPDIDVVLIGPYDLTASMGITAEFKHPRYLKARRAILQACKRHRVVPGLHVIQPNVSEVTQAIEEGYRFIAYSLDITMLTAACRDGLCGIRAGVGPGKGRKLLRAYHGTTAPQKLRQTTRDRNEGRKV